MKIKIDEEFRDLIPRLSESEYSALRQSLLEEGMREPIVIWSNDGSILDGHNRYQIATKENISIKKRDVFFRNKTEAKVWMIDNQRGRRNLSKNQLLELGMKRAELLEEKAKENQLQSLKKGTESPVFQESEKREPINTTKEMADYAGVSIDTASKYKKVMNEAPEEIKKEVQEGTKSINKAYQEIKKPDLTAIKPDFEQAEMNEQKRAENVAHSIIEYADRYLGNLNPTQKDIVISVLSQWVNEQGEKNG